jgi:two-component system response regulator FixJ
MAVTGQENNQGPRKMNSVFRRESATEEVGLFREGRTIKSVFVIDHEASLRDTLNSLLAAAGYQVRVFACAEAFLATLNARTSGVLIADLQVRRMSGLALQQELARRNAGLALIFMTTHDPLKTCVTAMKQGAVNILQKPLDRGELLGSVGEAFAQVEKQARARAIRGAITTRCASLTPREREVMLFIVRGLANRKIAQRIGVSARTVEVHRARVMEKMQATTLPDLVRQVEHCGPCENCTIAAVQHPSA